MVNSITMINYSFWLCFERGATGNKFGPVPRVTKNEPQTSRNERAVKCSVKLPASLFEIPSLSFKIDVDDQERPDLEARIETAAAAFKETAGLDIDMQIHRHDAEKP